MIIDSHIHPPFFKSDLFSHAAAEAGTDFTPVGLENEMRANGVAKALAYAIYMPGATLTNEQLAMATKNNGRLLPVASIDPANITPMESMLRDSEFTAVKIYPGYWNISALDKRFEPIYAACERNNTPVIIHMGDPLVKTASLRHCQPLVVDEIANNFQNLKIIICHYGFPWITETTEVLYKDQNVLADISGLFPKKHKYSDNAKKAIAQKITEGIWDIETAEDKILFGSDWLSMGMHIKDVLKEIEQWPLKDSVREKFFYKNSARVFNLE